MTKEEFCKEMSGDNNHRLLLWEALNSTKGTVVELGSGYGSTQYLRQYCKENKREFLTYDNGAEWAKIHGSTHIENWDTIEPKGSVILIDHAPGERRWIDIERLKDNFEYIVIHDSEPVGAGDYKLDKIWHNFKYRRNVEIDGSWASCVSNKENMESWVGQSYKEYKIS